MRISRSYHKLNRSFGNEISTTNAFTADRQSEKLQEDSSWEKEIHGEGGHSIVVFWSTKPWVFSLASGL